MNRNLIQRPVQLAVRRLVGGRFKFAFGMPFVTEDGFVLTDEDGNILLASGQSIQSANSPQRPFVTEDGFVLLDDNNNLLLGV